MERLVKAFDFMKTLPPEGLDLVLLLAAVYGITLCLIWEIGGFLTFHLFKFIRLVFRRMKDKLKF